MHQASQPTVFTLGSTQKPSFWPLHSQGFENLVLSVTEQSKQFSIEVVQFEKQSFGSQTFGAGVVLPLLLLFCIVKQGTNDLGL
jgi:hypothetical protein